MFVWIVEARYGGTENAWEPWDITSNLTREGARNEKKHFKRNHPEYKFRIRKYVREEE